MRRKSIIHRLRPALVLLAFLFLLLGGLYPLTIFGVAEAFFSHQAHGSLIQHNGKVIGSELLGQHFTEKKYFWGRPSSAVPPYNPEQAASENAGPISSELGVHIVERMKVLQDSDPKRRSDIPPSMLLTSASGLDPHITPLAAEFQVPRVARARRMSEKKLSAMVEEYTELPILGVFGKSRVNFLKLNLALDGIKINKTDKDLR